MRERVFLGIAQRRQQRARRRNDRRLRLQPELGRAFSELLTHEPFAGVIGKRRVRAVVDAAVQAVVQNALQHLALIRAAAKQHLDRREAAKLAANGLLRVRTLRARRVERAGGNVAEADAPVFAVFVDAGVVVVLGFLEHRAFRYGAGRHDADDVPLYEALCQRGVLHLFADGDLVALGDQPGNVAVRGMEGNAAHRRLILLLLAAVARREGEIQLSGRKLRVLVKHFIEIAQTEKQQAVGIARLDLAVLLHHGRQFSHFLTLFHGFAPEWHCFLCRCGTECLYAPDASGGHSFSVLAEKRFQPRFLSRMGKKAPLTVERGVPYGTRYR